jgi:hypothetical protein
LESKPERLSQGSAALLTDASKGIRTKL